MLDSILCVGSDRTPLDVEVSSIEYLIAGIGRKGASRVSRDSYEIMRPLNSSTYIVLFVIGDLIYQ